MFRFETIVVAALLGSPVAALWLRGDFTDADVWWRFGLCWLAAWAAISLLTAASRPLAGTTPTDASDSDDNATDDSTDETGQNQPSVVPGKPADAAPPTPS